MNLDSSIKALKTPPSRGWLRDKYSDFRAWWYIYVWIRYAPRWLFSLQYDISRFYYEQVSSRIWPRQAWLTKAVGRQWHDKPELIPTMLYASIIHFVSEDGENCFNVNHWDDKPEMEAKLREIYAWATGGRERYQEAITASMPGVDWSEMFKDNGIMNIPPIPNDIAAEDHYAYRYEASDALQAQFDKREKDYLHWIIDNKDYMWT